MLLMGVDMGTSGCKAVIFDEEWNVAAQAYREYQLHFPGDGYLELDPETVWNGICEVVAEANGICGEPVDALAVSAIGDVIIPLGKDGKALRNSIVDFDVRGKREIDAFVEEFGGAKKFFEITGMPPLYLGSLAKMLWIKEHEKDVFANVARWATYEDFLVERFGLAPSVSLSEAARTMLLDIRKKDWAADILELAPVKRSQLPQPVPSAAKLGYMDAGLAVKLGFRAPVQVASGGHDMVCAAVGAGLNEEENTTAVDIAGTIEGIVAAMPEANTGEEMLSNLLPCYPGFTGYVTFSVNVTAGCVVRWYRDVLDKDEWESCKKTGENFYEFFQRSVDPQMPGKLMLIPHFSGSGNPHFDSGAQGVIYGLNLDTQKEDIARAAVEGLCYELKQHTEAFEKAGIRLERLYAVGGGARVKKQLQLKANITGLAIEQGVVSESSAMGAAAYAAVAMGYIKNPAQAFGKIKKQGTLFKPDKQAAERFAAAYKNYEMLYQKIHQFEQLKQD